jgi:hypothetical protein
MRCTRQRAGDGQRQQGTQACQGLPTGDGGGIGHNKVEGLLIEYVQRVFQRGRERTGIAHLCERIVDEESKALIHFNHQEVRGARRRF